MHRLQLQRRYLCLRENQLNMKRYFFPTLILLFGLSGCLKKDDSPLRDLVTDPVSTYLGTDTLSRTGDLYMGLQLGETPESLYPVLQSLQKTASVGYVNVVGNSFTRLTDLEKRIPLYQSLDIEQSNGISVQLYFSERSISTMYLSTGKALIQWPESAAKSQAIAIGDAVDGLYAKVLTLSSGNSFRRFNLFTKDLTTGYDTSMSDSPQWYFAFSPSFGKTTLVHLNFSGRKLSSITVSKYERGG